MAVRSDWPRLILLAGLAGVPAPVSAEEQLLTVADPSVVTEAAKGFGSAELGTDSGGDPMVTGRIRGLKYVVYFYDCKNGKDCRSIQFSTGYTDPWTAERANEWNRKFRWIKAFEGDGSNFRMDVDFKGGITRDHLEQQFVTWDSFIEDIKDSVR